MKPSRILLLAIPLLVACGSSPASTPDAARTDDAGTPPADTGVVSPLPLPFYEVPVDDSSLAPHAFFVVPDVHYVRTGSTVTLTYDFPHDLSGIEDQEVELSGPVDAEGNATLSGPLGTGTCEVQNGIGRCIEHFTALPVDAAAARELAASYSASADAIAARRAVIDRFASDPIGIVVFDVVTASEPTD